MVNPIIGGSWIQEDEPGHLVTRYDSIRCPGCDRRLFCVRWEAYGYPEVNCPSCGVSDSWPFEEIEEIDLREIYENLDELDPELEVDVR